MELNRGFAALFWLLLFLNCLFVSLLTADGTCAGVRCSEHAQCLYGDDNSRKCVCNEGYQGDGQNCARMYLTHF